MWGRTKTSQQAENNVARDRLISVLRLDETDNFRSSQVRATVAVPIASETQPEFQPGDQIKRETAQPDGFSADMIALSQHLTPSANSFSERELPSLGRDAATDALTEPPNPGILKYTNLTRSETPEEPAVPVRAEPEELLEEQANRFQDRLAGIVNQTLSQSEATVHSTISRLEAYFAYGKQIESEIDAKLASLADKAMQAAQTQTKILEGEFSNIAGQVSSQIAVALQPVAGRIRDCRAQAEEISSTLETTLTRFTQSAADSTLEQTRTFEERLGSLSTQYIAQAQQNLLNEMAQIRESAARSMEQEMRSISERLQQSHFQSIQMGLEEMFEAAKVKVAALEHQSSESMTGLLHDIRTQSEAIKHELHQRFKADAEALEATLVDTMRSKLQKLTREFRSMFDGFPQDRPETVSQ